MDLRDTSKGLAYLASRSAKKIAKLALGHPLTTPPFGSATLDLDDVAIAEGKLKERKDWFDPQRVEEYQDAFASWNGSKHAFAFMAGRVALSACIYALGLEPDDEVILPGYTCVVVPNAFHFAGVKTVYSDIELDTYGLDAAIIEQKVTSKTKAILLHHLYGLVCRDYEKIIEIANRRGLYVIEDCAQATGAIFNNQKVGNLGDVAIYSSEQSKVFTTIQGGVATTNDESIAERLKERWDQSCYPGPHLVEKQLYNVIIDYYSHKDPQRWWKGGLMRFIHKDKLIISTTEEEKRGVRPLGYGCKMPSAIATIGINQLKKIDDYNKARGQTSKRWDEWCEINGYTRPFVVPNSVPIFLRYPVLVDPEKKRDRSWASKELRVSLGAWFVSNIHPVSHPVSGCPNANKAVESCVNFPSLAVQQF